MLQYHEMRPGVEDLKMEVEQAKVMNKTMSDLERLDAQQEARQAILQEIMDFRATEEAVNPHAVIEVVKDAAKTIGGAPWPDSKIKDIKIRKKMFAKYKKMEEKVSKFEFEVSLEFSSAVQ